jgi:hypothetical protein
MDVVPSQAFPWNLRSYDVQLPFVTMNSAFAVPHIP